MSGVGAVAILAGACNVISAPSVLVLGHALQLLELDLK